MRSAQRTVRRLHEVNQSIQLTATKETGGVSFEDYGDILIYRILRSPGIVFAHLQKRTGQTPSEVAHKYELISSS
jgi:hypothetical protein